MKKVTGYIKTNKVGSSCEFEFEVDDDESYEGIEEMAKDEAFNMIEWNFEVEGEEEV